MVIVDASVVKYKLIYGRDLKNEMIKTPEVLKHYFMNSILAIKNQFSCNKNNPLVLAIDKKGKFTNKDGTKGYGYWRDKYYYENKHKMDNTSGKVTSYKDGRHKPDDFDWDALEKYYHEAVDLLKDYSDFKVVKIAGIEADDICAILAQRSTKPVTIISTDKDLKQLVSDRVSFYCWNNKKYFKDTLSTDELKLFYLGGDNSDNIPPVKYRYQWKRNIKKKSMEEIFNEFPDINLEERYKINKKLMDLSINNVPKSLQKRIIDIYKEEQGRYHQLKLSKELRKLGVNLLVEGNIKSMLERMDEFKLQMNSIDTKTTKRNSVDRDRQNKIKKRFL